MLNVPLIGPKRPEDGALEDSARPQAVIKDAFSRAADSLRSRLSDASACVHDPGPSNGGLLDALIGTGEEGDYGQVCGGVVEKGDGREGDEVVVVGIGDGEEGGDRVLILGGDEKGMGLGCGLEAVGGEEKKVHGEEEHGEDEEADDQKPKLIEDVV